MPETKIKAALIRFTEGIKNSDGPAISAALGEVEALLTAHRRELHPQLVHFLEGRSYATPEDVQAVFEVTISHRLCFQPVYEMRRHEIAGPLIAGILGSVAAP